MHSNSPIIDFQKRTLRHESEDELLEIVYSTNAKKDEAQANWIYSIGIGTTDYDEIRELSLQVCRLGKTKRISRLIYDMMNGTIQIFVAKDRNGGR